MNIHRSESSRDVYQNELGSWIIISVTSEVAVSNQIKILIDKVAKRKFLLCRDTSYSRGYTHSQLKAVPFNQDLAQGPFILVVWGLIQKRSSLTFGFHCFGSVAFIWKAVKAHHICTDWVVLCWKSKKQSRYIWQKSKTTVNQVNKSYNFELKYLKLFPSIPTVAKLY